MLLIFAGDTYYPEGGALDLIGVAENLEGAMLMLTREAEHWMTAHATGNLCWAHVYDTDTRVIVRAWEYRRTHGDGYRITEVTPRDGNCAMEAAAGRRVWCNRERCTDAQ